MYAPSRATARGVLLRAEETAAAFAYGWCNIVADRQKRLPRLSPREPNLLALAVAGLVFLRRR